MGMKIGSRIIGIIIASLLAYLSHHIYTCAMRVLNSPLANETGVTLFLAGLAVVLAGAIFVLVIIIALAVLFG